MSPDKTTQEFKTEILRGLNTIVSQLPLSEEEKKGVNRAIMHVRRIETIKPEWLCEECGWIGYSEELGIDFKAAEQSFCPDCHSRKLSEVQYESASS